MGAEGFHGRVRDGIGCSPLARATRPSKSAGGWGFKSWCEIGALQQGMTAARDVSSALARGGDDAEEIKPVGRLVPLG